MTSGQRLDTNSQWLSKQLDELGVPVAFHTTVGDDIEDNVRVFREAVDRADIVVASGGLGPTADDLTRDALAQLLAVELVLHESSLAHIEAMFAKRNRTMPPRNRVQAMFPTGAQPIENTCGTAPGILVEAKSASGKNAFVVAMPGVPAEMKAMWRDYVVPEIRRRFPKLPVIARRVFKCFGVGESDLEAMLPDMIRRGRNPLVGITVSQATISLRLAATGDSWGDCNKLLDETEQEIRSCLGGLIFGEGEDELHDVVLRRLRERGETVASCEWGTAGLLASWLAGVGDAGTYRGGWISPQWTDLQKLTGLLEVAPMDATNSDGNSAGLVKRAAEAVRKMTQATYGLAIGPLVRDAQGELDYAHLCAASASQCVLQKVRLLANPDVLLPRTAKQALQELRKMLIEGRT